MAFETIVILSSQGRAAILTTRSSTVAEGPRDALRQLQSCQVLQNCTKNLILNALKEVNDLEGHSRSSEMALVS